MAKEATFNDVQREQIAQWFRSKLPELKCPLCQRLQDDPADRARKLFVANAGLLGPFFPNIALVALSCQNCGHMMFLDAKQMGLGSLTGLG